MARGRRINPAGIPGIACCCSNGLGSSMIVSMNVQQVLTELGISGVPVCHIALSDISFYTEYLLVCGLDIAPQLKGFKKVIILHDLIAKDELTEKIREAFANPSDSYRIG